MALPSLGAGVNRLVSIAPESTFATQGAGPAQLLRRVQSDMNLDVTPITSPEILPSQQVRDYRNGPRRVRGTFGAVLSPGTYKDFFDNHLRGTWTTGASKTGVTDSVASVSGDNLVLTSATAAWLTALLKRGDIVRITGATAGGAAVNNVNMRIVSVTATVLTLVPLSPITIPTWASGQTIAVNAVGKKLFTPATGQLKKSMTMEHWFSDISVSHLYTGLRVQQISLNFPAAGLVQMQAGLLGVDQTKSGSRVYASPTAVTSSSGLTMVAGRIAYQGANLTYITGLNLQISANLQADPVVGAATVPEIFLGTLQARGSVSLFMDDDTMTADFLAENEVELAAVGTTSPAANADFVSVYLGRVKLGAPTMTDGDMGMIRTYPFQAIEQIAGTSYDLTTVVVQDSLA
jgi:hypothetical protein